MGLALGARVATLTGVDIAPAMLALARRKGVYARLVESGIDAFLAAEPADSADLCVAADVFIYVGALDPVLAGRRLANFLKVMTLEAQTVARACGKNHLHNLEPEDLCALTVEAAAMARVPLAGTGWIPGQGTY